MYYVIRNRDMSTWLETNDGVVVSAARSFRWAIGKSIDAAMTSAKEKRLHVYVAEHDAAMITKIEVNGYDKETA